MIWFKTCPRCQMGDVILERDMHGWYLLCLQCGYVKDLLSCAEATAVLQQHGGQKELRAQSA